ncbi:hypothetical protein SAMN05421800_11841 [Chryseobacterium balustinum]|uniref:Uncharacterized protein n=1 Tax=Chryseobacterium balustinum TaxID=246 RepID=A0AAX2IJ39_9FLAO|nr:hypothetical protein SAMN05421800_11841 [Chryseobacterium balustinum]SQA88856.1 Uncharacterised protein [Chryseobacterium balustinum]
MYYFLAHVLYTLSANPSIAMINIVVAMLISIWVTGMTTT